MAVKNNNGQAVIEFVIVAFVLIMIFYGAFNAGKATINHLNQTRFQKTQGFK